MTARTARFVHGRWQKIEPKSEATPTLEHRVDRLFNIAMNFNERFVAIEQALARLQSAESNSASADPSPASSGNHRRDSTVSAPLSRKTTS
jgi:hypothetical protein